MNSPRVSYAPRPDATPEGELDALATVYAFVLQKGREKKKGTRPGAPEDGEESKNASTAETEYKR